MTTGIADRVKEFSTTTGTGTISLTSTAVGFRSFVNAIGDGNACAYVIEDGGSWEVGIGLVWDGGFLSREAVLQSSNSNALVTLSGGTKRVFIDRVEAFSGASMMTAGETLTANAAVFMGTGDQHGNGNGLMFLTDATQASKSVACAFAGITLTPADPDKPVLVRRHGVVQGDFGDHAAGQFCYLGNEPGSITQNPPANARRIGIAKSGDEIFLDDPNSFVNAIPTTASATNLGIIGQGIYGIASGGDSGSYQKGFGFDYLDLDTKVGNAANRGAVVSASTSYAAGGSSEIGVFAGGALGASSMITLSDVIQTFDRYVTSGDTSSVGVISQPRAGCAGASGPERMFIGGGLSASGVSNVVDMIEFSTFTDNSSDIGDLMIARRNLAGCANEDSGFFAGGSTAAGAVSLIDMVDLDTGVQNAASRGDLTSRRTALAGMPGVLCVFGGGVDSGFVGTLDVIDVNTFSTLALDRGVLTVPRAFLAAAASEFNGVFCGGQNGIDLDLIEAVDHTLSTVEVTDRGIISYARSALSGT